MKDTRQNSLCVAISIKKRMIWRAVQCNGSVPVNLWWTC